MQIFSTKVDGHKKNPANICSRAKIIVLLQTNLFVVLICGISTSVVHRLPKPRRRVRFPYAAHSISVYRGVREEIYGIIFEFIIQNS